MIRYHRSFIGLMEQNNEGEWVRHEEAAKQLCKADASYEDVVQLYSDQSEICDEAIEMASKYSQKCTTLENQIFEITAENSLLRAVVVALLVCCSANLLLQRVFG